MSAVLNQNSLNEIIKANLSNAEVIVTSVLDVIGEIGNDNLVKKLEKNSGNFKKVSGFVKSYAELIDSVVVSMSAVKIPGSVEATVNKSVDIIKRLISVLTDKEFDALGNKDTMNKIKATCDAIIGVSNVFKSIASMIKQSFLIMTFGWVVKIAIKVVLWIAKSFDNFGKKPISKEAIKNIEMLNKIVRSLLDVMKKLTIMIPLSIVAVAGAIVATAFVLVLMAFVVVVGFLLRIISRTLRKTEFELLKIKAIFLTLLMIGATILIFALATPILVRALAGNIIPFVLFLLASIVLLWVILWIAKKVTFQAGKEAFMTAFYVLVIVGLLFVIGLAMLAAGELGRYLLEENAILNIIVGMIGVIVVATIVVLLGMALEAAAPHLPACDAVLPALAVTIGLLIGAAIVLVEFAIVGKKLQEEDAIVNVLIGMVAIIIVSALIIALGALMVALIEVIGPCDAGLVLIAATVGLMIAAGLMVVGLIWVGAQIREGDNLENIIYGIIATIIVSVLIIGMGALMLLLVQVAGPVAAGLAIIGATIGLLFVSALMLVGFAWIGKKIREDGVIEDIAVAIIGTVIVTGLCIGLGWAMIPFMAHAAFATAGLSLIGMVVGLLFVSALMLIGFAWVGKKIREEDTIINIGIAIGATVLFAALVVGLSFALIPLMAAAQFSSSGLLLMAATIGLLLVSALAILKLADYGIELETKGSNDKTAYENALSALDKLTTFGWELSWFCLQLVPMGVCFILGTVMALFYLSTIWLVVSVVYGVIALGEVGITLVDKKYVITDSEDKGSAEKAIDILTTFGWELSWFCLQLVPMGVCFILGTVMALFYLSAIWLVVSVTYGVISLGELGQVLEEKKYVIIEGDDQGYAEKAVSALSVFGWRLAGLGMEMIPIGAACLILIAAITPFLGAIEMIVMAIQSIEVIAKTEYEFAKIEEQFDNIGKFWEQFKVFIDKFNWKDLLLIPKMMMMSSAVQGVTAAINTIVEQLKQIEQITLDYAAIKNNVDSIFSFIEELSKHINKLLTTSDREQEEGLWGTVKGWFGRIKDQIEDNIDHQIAIDKLNKVEQICKVLNTIATSLNEIQKITLDGTLIKNNVKAIFDFVNDLAVYINNMLKADMNFGYTDENYVYARAAELSSRILPEDSPITGYFKSKAEEGTAVDKMNKVDMITASMGSIAASLNAIMELRVDEDAIKKKVALIFAFIKDLAIQIEVHMSTLEVFKDTVSTVYDTRTKTEGALLWKKTTKERIARQVVTKNENPAKFDNVGKIFYVLQTIVGTLKSIKEIGLTEKDQKQIEGNIDAIFTFIEKIVNKIDTLMKDGNVGKILAEAIKADSAASGLSNSSTFSSSSIIGKYASQSTTDSSGDKPVSLTKAMEVLSTIFDKLKAMTQSLDEIKNLKISANDGVEIEKRINYIFSAVDIITEMINEKREGITASAGNIKVIYESIEMQINLLQKLNEGFDTFGKNDAGNFKKNIDSFGKLINTLQGASEAKTKSLTDLVTTLSKVPTAHNDAFDGYTNLFKECINLSKSNVGNVTKSLNECGKFVQKINSIEVNKIKYTAEMFKRMAEFSNSIRGNFDKLAEALGEKLLPVLEELKEVMLDVPQTLEKGFSKTSESIESATKVKTTEDYIKQVKRENPGISDEEAAKLGNAKASANQIALLSTKIDGVNTKLAELYKLFNSGSLSGNVAKVKLLSSD
jgi:hypothetical protein